MNYDNISVRRHSDNSRGPTPTEENGLADSTNKPNESLSSISVVTHSGGRYVDAPPPSSRLRCRDFDGKFLSLDFNPFKTNGIFHKATYNKVRMVHCIYLGVTGYNFQKSMEAQWLSCRLVLDSRPRICRLELFRHHCLVALSKTHLSLLSTGSIQEDLSRHNLKSVDWDVKNPIKQTKNLVFLSLKIDFLFNNKQCRP